MWATTLAPYAFGLMLDLEIHVVSMGENLLSVLLGQGICHDRPQTYKIKAESLSKEVQGHFLKATGAFFNFLKIQ